MDLQQIGNLLSKIGIHYPNFKKHCSTEDGKMISKNFAEEWYRVIGYLDFEEALRKFDQYLKLPEGNKYPPDVKWFLAEKTAHKESKIFHAPVRGKRHLEFMPWDQQHLHGRMRDEEEREYVHNPTYEDGYHYDRQGNICDLNGNIIWHWAN